MRVGLIHRAFWRRPRLRDWADHLEAAGHRTMVFSSGVDRHASTDRRTFVPVPLGRGESFDRAGFAFAARLYPALLRHPVDAMFCIDSTAYFAAWLAARRLRVPAIMSFEGWIYSPGIRKVYPRTATWSYELAVHFCARWAPLIGCLNREIYDGLRARGASAERLWLAPNGVTLASWVARKTGARARQPRQVLYVGGLRREKGFDVLLKAIPVIVRRFPDVQFKVLGGRVSEGGPYHNMARQLGVADCVAFGGSVAREDLAEIYASADVLVSPSRAEGHAVAPMECLACGTPVIASDIPGLRESVRHGENGLLVPAADSQALANAVCRVLGDHALLDRLSRAARPSVERFSKWSKRIHEFEEHVFRLRCDQSSAPAEHWECTARR